MSTVVIKARKIFTNKLLSRKQVVLDVVHPGKPNVSKDQLRELVAKKFKCDDKNVVVFGMKTQFGGTRSTGFALIYDSQEYLLKYEPKQRLRKSKILPERQPQRKSYKELKRKLLRNRGKEKSKLQKTKKGIQRTELKKIKADYLKNQAQR